MDITVVDLSAAHLNQIVTVTSRASESSWTLTGRLSGVEYTALPDSEDEPGARDARLSLGLGDGRAVLSLDLDHPITVHE